MIRVVIADDQDLIRVGLRTILEAEDDIVVVGEAESGPAAARVAAAAGADVVLMDVEMPGGDGIAAVLAVISERPAARVIMLTTFDLDDYVADSLRAGASGFLLKTTPRTELVAAIRRVHQGELMFAPTVTRRLVETFVTAPSSRSAERTLRELTERERDVFLELATGASNAEIAARLYLGEATVKTHVTRILAKLGVHDRIQAVVHAYESGVVRPSGDRI
ncbi:response regulator transcription factor [Georgenia yuyongxinii]|uniref:Response regulator transcription factor n=1 Tax=Georgenia yuyongxinii TaxID=2589797 RepID=A0A5B8C2U5_9MICO|nr:response regulator transcription factor [Georgenia yuyongxinii]QDC23555.1 response regulator transcription factor [Georgenia yuyongxinii]